MLDRNMKQFLLFIILVVCGLKGLSAQEIKVKRFARAEEINWEPAQRQDNNGVPCALIRVAVPFDKHVLFRGNVIGSVKYEGNEYWVYLSEESHFLRVHYPGYETLLVNFETFGFDGVESKNVYELVLTLPERESSTLSEAEYQQLIAVALSEQKQENFAEAITQYEACKQKLADQDEQGYVQAVQESIDYCKRRIALQKLKADIWAENLIEGLCKFRVDGKWGFVDSVGNLVVSPVYDKTWAPHAGVVWVKKEGLWGSINLAGEMIVPYQYKSVTYYNPEDYALNRCLSVSKDHKYVGVIDYKTGEEILSCKYHSVSLPNLGSGGYVCYVDEKERPVFINQKTGEEQFKLSKGIKFEGYLPLGYCLVYKEGRCGVKLYGLVDEYGDEVFPCQYRQFQYPDGFAKIPSWFIRVNKFPEYDHECTVRLYNLKQRLYVGDWYSEIFFRQATESLVAVCYYNYSGHKFMGVLNYLTGKEILPPNPKHEIKDIALPISEYDPVVAKSYRGKSYLYDMDGNRYDAPQSDVELAYQYGYTRVKRNGKYGFANAKGELVLDCLYDGAGNFIWLEDIVAASVSIGEKSFYITPDGVQIEDEVFDAKYEKIYGQ